MADKNSIPSIKSIGYLLVYDLPSNIILSVQARLPVTIPMPKWMDFSGTPECVSETNNANNGQQGNAKLTFNSLTLISPEADYAFVVVDCHNNIYLIGTREAPYPIMNRTYSFGSPDGEPRVVKYEIEYNAVSALIPCKIV